MGYCDSVDPAKMEIESSSFIPSVSNADSTPQIISSGAKEREENATGAASSVNKERPSTSAGVKRGCKEVRDHFIKFPLARQELQELMDEFEEEYGIPQIVGAIDGCHIEINAPPDNHEDYFNSKQQYSVNLQAIVNCNLKFIHVSFGYRGSIHDAREKMNKFLTPINEICQWNRNPPLIMADSAYPLLKWLVKPYPNRGHLTADEREFNKKLSAARSVVERAFGMLKGRCRLLLKKVEQQTRTLSKTVLTACVLHNICFDHGDLYDCSDSDSDGSDSEDDYAGPERH
ncbi:putative nuclease HARBI1 [Acropora cervicornis]|uniref:Nuclease HARBI1 n=1 Tax=Acropora cervicornis TaxID=6130 RepID=A0AAD9QW49_ACRCE|nr:putative nuclease HARBI1 [Acropora cervicornis]